MEKGESSSDEFQAAKPTDVRLPAGPVINVSDLLLDKDRETEEDDEKIIAEDEVPAESKNIFNKQELEENIYSGLERRVNKFKTLESDVDSSEDDWRSKVV